MKTFVFISPSYHFDNHPSKTEGFLFPLPVSFKSPNNSKLNIGEGFIIIPTHFLSVGTILEIYREIKLKKCKSIFDQTWKR